MQLKRGINLGGWLSQCCHTQEHYNSFITAADIKSIASMGFDHVRLPVDAEVLSAADGRIIESGYTRIENTVRTCAELGLDIIIDIHKAYGYDFNDAGNSDKNNLFSSDALRQRFIDMWDTISKRFAGYENVAFELLNEVVETENNEGWNSLVDSCVKAIRKNAPNAPIIYGGIQWNSARTLKLLRKPVSDNIIYTFHFYEPLLFTHQKAPWVAAMSPDRSHSYPETMEYYRAESLALGEQGCGVVESTAQTMGTEFIEEMINEAITAANNAGVPLYCGEFGVIDRAPIEDTLRWFEDIDSVFRKYDIGFGLWCYKQMDFGLIGEHYDAIRERLLKLWSRK